MKTKRSNTNLCLSTLAIALLLTATAAHGQHYVSGVEGIKAATLPPPGHYWRTYGVYYSADELRDHNGDKAPLDFEVSVYALVNRYIWSSPIEILGGNYVADIIVPIVREDVKINVPGAQPQPAAPRGCFDDAPAGPPPAYDKSRTGLGDICVEPLIIAWHGERYDAAAGVGLFIPTGNYDRDEAANPGRGMWTGMGTLGGTLYLDREKTWSASILGRYEIHSKVRSDDCRKFTPGNDFHFEWGLGKTLGRFYDVGLTGYCYWQTTHDSGTGLSDTHLGRVFSAGPEVMAFFPDIGLFASLRSQWEFGARDRSQGHITSLVLTKIF